MSLKKIVETILRRPNGLNNGFNGFAATTAEKLPHGGGYTIYLHNSSDMQALTFKDLRDFMRSVCEDAGVAEDSIRYVLKYNSLTGASLKIRAA